MTEFSKLKLMEIANRVPLFKSLSSYEKQQVISIPKLVRVIKQHCKFIVFGEHDDSFYILLSGVAGVYQHEHKIATIEGGQFVGEVGFICGDARTASVVAETDLVTFCIDRKRFAMLPLALRDKIKDRLINGLVQRVEHMNQHIAELDAVIGRFETGDDGMAAAPFPAPQLNDDLVADPKPPPAPSAVEPGVVELPVREHNAGTSTVKRRSPWR